MVWETYAANLIGTLLTGLFVLTIGAIIFYAGDFGLAPPFLGRIDAISATAFSALGLVGVGTVGLKLIRGHGSMGQGSMNR